MRTVEEYRKRAQEAVELAQKARKSERATLLNIAQVWLKLADEREAELRAAISEIPKLKAASLLKQTPAPAEQFKHS
jgi:hypothetical protein